MKKIVFFLILALSNFSFAQENSFKKLLQVDSTWKNEFFQFPISFAPSIHFEGYEEAVFPKSWSDSSSFEFWSYAFAWEIARKEILTEREIETALTSYFNGLMNVDSTHCKIFKNDPVSEQTIYFGSLSTLDAFFSKQAFNLNVRIEQYFNKKSKKMLVLFKFSPQSFEKDIWTYLDVIKPISSRFKVL